MPSSSKQTNNTNSTIIQVTQATSDEQFPQRPWCTYWLLAALAAAGGGLMLMSDNLPSLFHHPLVLIILGLALGLLCAALLFQAALQGALKQMKSNSAQAAPARGLPFWLGWSSLNQLTALHQRKILSLLDIIRTIENQSENLLNRYQTLSAKIAAAVVIRDANGKITFCNPYTEVLTGYSLSEIYAARGDFFLQTVHEEDRPHYLRAFKISSLGDNMQIRYRVFHKTGIEMWLETITEPIIEDGEITGYISTTLDVSELVRRQKQVEEKNRDLYDFTYMISHDLKAPIFTIKGMINLLKEDLSQQINADIKETINHIIKAADTMERLVHSVLQYFRISNQEDKLESIDLKTLCADIATNYSRQIQDSQANITVDPNLPVILGDRTKLYQIFSNLIGNALKYRDPARPPIVAVSLRPTPHNREIKIAVSDNGLGIPAEKLELIFRPFQRAHGNKIEGSGIGLACVKKLLERIGGAITVESQVGQGSVFTVTLRQLDAPAATSAAHSP